MVWSFCRVEIYLEEASWLKDVMDLHKSYIFAEILADGVHWGSGGIRAEVEIDDFQCTIGLKNQFMSKTSYTDAELQEFEAIILKNE